jgi:hypothetical protein
MATTSTSAPVRDRDLMNDAINGVRKLGDDEKSKVKEILEQAVTRSKPEQNDKVQQKGTLQPLALGLDWAHLTDLLALEDMLDDVLPPLQGGGRGNLCKEWEDISKMCRAIVADSALLTVRVALGKSLYLRAPTPMLSMVAVDLMRKIEKFIGNMNAWKTPPTDADKMAQGAWFKVLGVIVYFQLPVHVNATVKNGVPGGNGRRWAVP